MTGERPRPIVRARRTAVTFDSTGGIRIGGIPQFTSAVTDFADLTRDPEPVIIGGRIWSPANLVAAVVHNLRAAEPTDDEGTAAVTTYPATYSDKQVALLRQALDLSGAREIGLIPEPVAAAEWLEHEHGPLEPGFVLVYDLGGNSLDVTVVRVGSDWENHPMVGNPVRSYDFGGKPLGAMIARYARDTESGATASVSGLSMVDTDQLRVTHVRDSLEVVRSGVRRAGITMSDVSRILLVGGAARPAEVAATVAELGRPVVISTDPGQTISAGAAIMAAKTAGFGASEGRHSAPRVAVFSSAAVVSAVAMSAATVFGGPSGDPGLSPLQNRPFGTAGALLDSSTSVAPVWTAVPASGWLSGTSTGSPKTSAYGRFITPAAHVTPYSTSTDEGVRQESSPSGGSRHSFESHNPTENHPVPKRAKSGDYSDPAYFVNPMPFVKRLPVPATQAPTPPDDDKPTDPPPATDSGATKPVSHGDSTSGAASDAADKTPKDTSAGNPSNGGWTNHDTDTGVSVPSPAGNQTGHAPDLPDIPDGSSDTTTGTPSSGESDTSPGAGSAPGTGTGTEAGTDTGSGTDTGAGSDTGTDTGTGTDTDAGTGVGPDAGTGTGTGAGTGTGTGTGNGAGTGIGTGSDTGADSGGASNNGGLSTGASGTESSRNNSTGATTRNGSLGNHSSPNQSGKSSNSPSSGATPSGGNSSGKFGGSTGGSTSHTGSTGRTGSSPSGGLSSRGSSLGGGTSGGSHSGGMGGARGSH
ncbi:hypothetical protein GCM10023318_59030 [Nocardia callitridis]|uniref:Hsp70 protein n=1 Tax=Nocardia callitridis TaxID=648753 RepID=A0ABP9KZP2_9NOCA